MEGRIVALSCGIYSVYANGMIYRVPARGLFRSRNIKPIVGDQVDIDETTSVIHIVHDRVTYLKRPPVANIDQMMIVQSLVQPDFSYLLTFKYLTYANSKGINAKIILTKSDKFEDENKLNEILNTFKALGIEIFVVSNKTQQGLDEIRDLFNNHITCLIGQTGVGKSSLINAIDPSFEREIGDYSYALGRGKHQTKEVILLPYQGGYIVDTPGFSSLELELYKEDLAIFFPGFESRHEKCYFSDCLHLSENHCVVKEAINNHEIPEIAYECYKKLSDEAIFRFKRFDK